MTENQRLPFQHMTDSVVTASNLLQSTLARRAEDFSTPSEAMAAGLAMSIIGLTHALLANTNDPEGVIKLARAEFEQDVQFDELEVVGFDVLGDIMTVNPSDKPN